MKKTTLMVGLLGLSLSSTILSASEISIVNNMSGSGNLLISDHMSVESSVLDRDIPLRFEQERIALDPHAVGSGDLFNTHWNTSAYIEHKLFYMLTHTLMHSNVVNFFPDSMVRLNQYFIDDKKPQCNGLHFQVQSHWQSYYLQLEYRF